MASQSNIQTVALQLEKVRDKLPKLYETDKTFWGAIKQKGEADTVSSRFMRIPLQLIPGGIAGGFNPDGGDLGRGSGITWDVAQVTPNWQEFAVELTKLVEWATRQPQQAIENAFRYQLKEAMVQFDAYLDMLMQSNGNGILGTILTTPGASPTLAMATPYGASLVFDNNHYNILNAALTAQRLGPNSDGSVTVQAHDAITTKTIILSQNAPAATVATDVIVERGVTPGNTVSYFGVPYQVSNATTGTWLNLNRGTYPYQLQSGRVNANNSALTPGMVRLALNQIKLALGSDSVKNSKLGAYMNVQQEAAWENAGILISQIIKEGAGGRANDLDLNFTGDFTMAGVPVKTSIHWNQTRIDFLALSHWGRAVMKDMDFYDVDGTTIFPLYGASGGLQAGQIFYLVIGQQFFTDNPRSQSFIDTLSVPSGY